MCAGLYKVKATLNYNGQEIKELNKFINLIDLVPGDEDFERHQIKLVIFSNDTYEIIVDGVSN